MDTVYLNVSDNNGNMAAMQPFTISIKATDNHPPVVTIHSNLEVGGCLYLYFVFSLESCPFQ